MLDKPHPEARTIEDRLRQTHANLRARGMVTASEVMLEAISFVDRCVRERDEAREEMKRIKALEVEIGRLRYQNAQLSKARDDARDDAKRAAIPTEEAQALARAEVRAALRPFLMDGVQSQRMLAMTIKTALDQVWGKEPA